MGILRQKPQHSCHGPQPYQGALDARARDSSSDPSQRRRISLSSSERGVPRGWSVNPTRLTCRNEPDGDDLCLDCAFVSDDVHVATTGVNKRHPCGVHVRRAAPFREG
jgi:hypothetical protein